MIKFNAWLFLINLEIQEESFYISFTLHLLQFLYYLFTLSHHNFTFYIIKPHYLLKVIDKRKKICHLEKLMQSNGVLAPSPFLTKGRGYPSGHKTLLSHLQIVFNLSYLDKTYIRCLQDKLTATNFKSAQKCLEKTSNRFLIKMST